MKKYFAEFFGTFTLSFVVGLLVSGQFAPFTPFMAAVTLGLFVYTIGVLSGCHINPAVTIGLLSIGKIKIDQASRYIVAQFLGAFLAVLILGKLSRILLPVMAAPNYLSGFAEMMGTMVFTFGIASVVYGKAPAQMNGFVVGGSLLLGIVVAAAIGSAGILNPAVAITVRAFNPTYVVGQIVGAVLGFNLYKHLQK